MPLPAETGPVANLTVLTCNPGPPGAFEESCDRFKLIYIVLGGGIVDWTNSRHKPILIFEAMRRIRTEYVMYADSLDSVLLEHPRVTLERFRAEFSSELVFMASRRSAPSCESFERFERKLGASSGGDRIYLDGAAWIGRTAFCKEFFGAAVSTNALGSAPASERGVLRQIFPRYSQSVKLDYNAGIFHSLEGSDAGGTMNK